MKKLSLAIISFMMLSTAYANICLSDKIAGSYQSRLSFFEVLISDETVDLEFWVPIYNFNLKDMGDGTLKFTLTGFTDQGEALLFLETVEEKNELLSQFQLLEKEILKVKEIDGRCAIVTDNNVGFAYVKDTTQIFNVQVDKGKVYYSEIMVKSL